MSIETTYFEDNSCVIPLEFEEVYLIETSDPYVGPYSATPQIQAQTFETEDKLMTDNFVVNGIPKSDVINQQGGYTCTIGG